VGDGQRVFTHHHRVTAPVVAVAIRGAKDLRGAPDDSSNYNPVSVLAGAWIESDDSGRSSLFDHDGP